MKKRRRRRHEACLGGYESNRSFAMCCCIMGEWWWEKCGGCLTGKLQRLFTICEEWWMCGLVVYELIFCSSAFMKSRGDVVKKSFISFRLKGKEKKMKWSYDGKEKSYGRSGKVPDAGTLLPGESQQVYKWVWAVWKAVGLALCVW